MKSGTRQTIDLSPVGGTVLSWRFENRDIFFPQQTLTIDGAKKLRGGMHSCFPNYGREQPDYHLPSHGPLRYLEGNLEQDGRRVVFGGRKILAENIYCDVSVSVEEPDDKSMLYTLSALLSPAASKPFPTNAGFHPYFGTPDGTATVLADGNKYVVDDLITEAKVLPLKCTIYVVIPGMGTVRISPGKTFLECKTARMVLWRDSKDYLCVEPVLGVSADFSGGFCPKLIPGERFDLSCKFELV